MKKIIYGVVLIGALWLTGCADAGKDQSVASGEVVTLNGSASKADFFGTLKKYRWKQEKGSKVTLSDMKAVTPTFTAPAVSKKTTLVFHLETMETGGYFSPWKTEDEVTIVINPPSTENKLPQAVATVSSETIKYGQSVTFDANASSDSDGQIVSYEWKDAAGNLLGSGVTLTHTFESIGTHPVTLTVTDDEGATATASVTVTVNTLQKPLADINTSATVVRINDTVTFDANASSDGDGEIISYQWTDAQGNVLSNMMSFTHSFATSGEHNITLTVMDDDEQVGTSKVSILVEALLLSVSLSSDVTTLEVNQTTGLNAIAHYNDDSALSVSTSAEWIVGDTSVATIDANGILKALQAGVTNIIAKVGDVESNVISIEVMPQDTTPPVLTLNGEANLTLIQGTPYTELGATATDDKDENVTVTQTGTVDTNTVGTYTLTYTATDKAGNSSTVTRTVNVVLPPDITPPTLTLNSESTITLYQGGNYTELGAIAMDDRDGNVSVSISGNVDTSKVGQYTVTYTSIDNAGNTATAERTVNVVLPPDTEAPVITINGDANITLILGENYEELGASATDQRDGDVNVTTTGSVDTSTEGTYTIAYTATDIAGNEVTATRIVTIVAPILTSISLESNVTTLNVGEKAELTLMGTYSDGNTKELDVNVEYIITPSDSAEMNGTVLTAKRDGEVTVQAKVGSTLSHTLNLNITWIVDGYVLPPEPDSVENDATLGGVDSNSNGVRDDVERNIYATYPVKLHRGLLMYGATVFQEIMIKPSEQAKETQKGITKIINCRIYLRRKDSEIKSDEFGLITFLENKTVNSKERVRKYLDYNLALSGGSYGSSPSDWNRESCSPQIIRALEEIGK